MLAFALPLKYNVHNETALGGIMNQLSIEKRAQIIGMLVEGNSMRGRVPYG